MLLPKDRALLVGLVIGIFTVIALVFDGFFPALFWAFGALAASLTGALIGDDGDNNRRWTAFFLFVIAGIVGWIMSYNTQANANYPLMVKFMQAVTLFYVPCFTIAYRRNIKLVSEEQK